MSYYRRSSSSLSSIRATLITRRYNLLSSSITHPHQQHDDDNNKQTSKSNNIHKFLQHRSFVTAFNNKRHTISSFLLPTSTNTNTNTTTTTTAFVHYMSTTAATTQSNDGLVVNTDFMTDDIFADTTIQATVSNVAPAISEVAVAASDSAFPVAALQFVIDYVHTFTGFSWWSSIVVTTLLIRTLTVPLLVNQLKSTTKLAHMKPRLEAIKEEIDNKGNNPMAVAEGQKRMKSLFKEYGVSPFTPLKGLFIQAPIFISFFLAISNMAEKVPSFKTGGAFWFLDLTTPDPLWALPVLTALGFLINVECNMQQGMEGNAMGATMKNVSRGLAVLTVPFTHNFPKAIFCYWITSNLFSLAYGLVLRAPAAKRILGIPELPTVPPSAAAPQNFDLFSAIKKATTVSKIPNPGPPSIEASKPADRKTSSSTVLNQKVRALEKKVKGRKKNRK
ncbi:hypothetical protein ACFE04_009086 [Oxalis oulophora]